MYRRSTSLVLLSALMFVAGSLMAPAAWALDPTDPALVGVWLFDEGEGDETKDEINDNTGFLNFEDDFEWETDGRFGGAIAAFGGGAIDVEESDSIASIEEGLTVAAWFRIDAGSDTGVRKNGAFLLEDQSGAEPIPEGFSFRVWTDQGITPGFYGSTELEQERWYHIAGTYDSDSGLVEMYIDGEPESENGDVLDAGGAVWEPEWGGLVSPGSPLQLKYGPEAYNGAIDEVAIFSRALSGDEIKELMLGFPWQGGGGDTGDYNGDGVLDAADADLQSAEMKKPEADQDLATFDHNDDKVVNVDDRLIWVKDLRKTWVGDSNNDGEFNSSDLVAVFGEGLYETGNMAGWAAGDWDGDMLFNSTDLVFAFTDGGYELGPQPEGGAVPEPTSLVLLLLGGLMMLVKRRK